MQFYELRKYANLVAYPLAVLVIVQLINYRFSLGNVMSLIEIFTYSFIALYATKTLKMRKGETVIVAACVGLIYSLFTQSFHLLTGKEFSFYLFSMQVLTAIVASFVVAWITKKYMVVK